MYLFFSLLFLFYLFILLTDWCLVASERSFKRRTCLNSSLPTHHQPTDLFWWNHGVESKKEELFEGSQPHFMTAATRHQDPTSVKRLLSSPRSTWIKIILGEQELRLKQQKKEEVLLQRQGKIMELLAGGGMARPTGPVSDRLRCGGRWWGRMSGVHFSATSGSFLTTSLLFSTRCCSGNLSSKLHTNMVFHMHNLYVYYSFIMVYYLYVWCVN